MQNAILDWLVSETTMFGIPIQHWLLMFAAGFIILIPTLAWLDQRYFPK
jgi:hypothetical protein